MGKQTVSSCDTELAYLDRTPVSLSRQKFGHMNWDFEFLLKGDTALLSNLRSKGLKQTHSVDLSDDELLAFWDKDSGEARTEGEDKWLDITDFYWRECDYRTLQTHRLGQKGLKENEA